MRHPGADATVDSAVFNRAQAKSHGCRISLHVVGRLQWFSTMIRAGTDPLCHVHHRHVFDCSVIIIIYADDSKISKEVGDEIDGVALQRDLDQLSNWEWKWQLTFQVDKC